MILRSVTFNDCDLNVFHFRFDANGFDFDSDSTRFVSFRFISCVFRGIDGWMNEWMNNRQIDRWVKCFIRAHCHQCKFKREFHGVNCTNNNTFKRSICNRKATELFWWECCYESQPKKRERFNAIPWQCYIQNELILATICHFAIYLTFIIRRYYYTSVRIATKTGKDTQKLELLKLYHLSGDFLLSLAFKLWRSHNRFEINNNVRMQRNNSEKIRTKSPNLSHEHTHTHAAWHTLLFGYYVNNKCAKQTLGTFSKRLRSRWNI